MIDLSRRKLIGGLGLLIASPAIVRISSLMPVKVWRAAEWDKDRIIAALIAHSDAQWEGSDMIWTPAEVEAHKKFGGWPEYSLSDGRSRSNLLESFQAPVNRLLPDTIRS